MKKLLHARVLSLLTTLSHPSPFLLSTPVHFFSLLPTVSSPFSIPLSITLYSLSIPSLSLAQDARLSAHRKEVRYLRSVVQAYEKLLGSQSALGMAGVQSQAAGGGQAHVRHCTVFLLAVYSCFHNCCLFHPRKHVLTVFRSLQSCSLIGCCARAPPLAATAAF